MNKKNLSYKLQNSLKYKYKKINWKKGKYWKWLYKLNEKLENEMEIRQVE